MDQFRCVYDDRPLPLLIQDLVFHEACLKFVKASNVRRAFILSSRSLASKTNALSLLRASLGDVAVGEFVGVGAHTPIPDCVRLIEAMRAAGDVDCLITLGGGSLTDAGKLARFALANEAYTVEAVTSLWGGPGHENPNRRKDVKSPVITLVHIPTTLSGGEFQGLLGATDLATNAKLFFAPGVEPTLTIQDPSVCLHTPANLWLSSGIRAVDHCVETICSLQSNDKADAEARKGLQQLIPGLLRCKSDPGDVEAISLCQHGVVSAMAACSSGVPLGASHAIGHQLGPLGVAHGDTSCILLPAVCKYNAEKKANIHRQSICREILLNENTVQALMKGHHMTDPDLADILDAIIRAMGLPRSLSEVGVTKDQFQGLARNSLDDLWIKTNAVKITEESQVLEILKMVA